MFDNEDTVDFCFCFFSFIRLDDFVRDGIPSLIMGLGLAAAALELVVDLMDRFLVIMENLFSSLLTTTDLGCIEWTDKSSAVKNEPLLPKSTSHCLRILLLILIQWLITHPSIVVEMRTNAERRFHCYYSWVACLCFVRFT